MMSDLHGGTAAWHIRQGTAGDLPLLRRMLYEAHYWRPERPRQPLDEMLADPILACYLRGWGRPGDFAVVAETAQSQSIGAAWYRLFKADEPGYGFIDASIPELAIGVTPEDRGQGVGGALLAALLNAAQDAGFAAVSLGVDFANPAVKLYERYGFIKAAADEAGWIMRRDFEQSMAVKPRA